MSTTRTQVGSTCFLFRGESAVYASQQFSTRGEWVVAYARESGGREMLRTADRDTAMRKAKTLASKVAQ